MTMISDVNELRPIVEKALKSLYGSDIKGIHMKETNHLDMLKEWYITVRFETDKEEKSLSMTVKDDGKITKTNEYFSWPIRK